MTFARFALGLLLLTASIAAVGAGCRQLRRRYLPAWTGLDATLADIVLCLTLVELLSQVAGAFGVFRLAVMAPALLVGGLALRVAVRAPAQDAGLADRSEPASPPLPRWHVAIAGIVVAVVAGSWVNRTRFSLRGGMMAIDARWYHLPAAARFVQTGHLLPIHYFDGDPTTAFFPMNSEVLHALGMMFTGIDMLSIVVNLGWFALAIAAAWSIGRRFGVSPAAAVGVALVLGTPGMVATQPGGPLTDVVGLALLLTAVAFLSKSVDGERTGAHDVIVVLAGGLAVGSKFSFVGPVAVLFVCLIATMPKGRKVARSATSLGALVLTGGFWYLRNLIDVGNPLPSLHVNFGPLSLPSVKGSLAVSSVSEFVTEGSAWRRFFIPGFRQAWGPVWPALALVLAVAVVVGIFVRRGPVVRALWVLTTACIVIFLYTPQFLTLWGFPTFFAVNLRYFAPARVIGVVVTPIYLVRWRSIVLLTLAALTAATQLDPTSWPDRIDWAVFPDHARGIDARWGVAAVVVVALVWLCRTYVPNLVGRRTGAVTSFATVGMVLVLLVACRPGYLRGRYGAPFVDSIHHQRIAIVPGPYMALQFPYYGSDLSNVVQLTVQRNGDHLEVPSTCTSWLTFLRRGRYDYVVWSTPERPGSTVPSRPRSIKQGKWTMELPGVRQVQKLRTPSLTFWVYKLEGPADPAVCRR